MSADLLAKGLVCETPDDRPGRSRGRGRPRVLLEIQADGALIIAASLTWQGAFEATFVNLAGEFLYGSSKPVAVHDTIDSLILELMSILETIIGDSPFDAHQIARIAIALPGAVDSRNGLVRWIPTLPRGNSPVAAIIQQRLNVPVTIESDLEALARARYWFSDGPMPPSFMLLHIGFGVGAAHYVNDAPRMTTSGISEFGHVKTDFGADARACFCGGKGCVTAYSSMSGILEKVGRWDPRSENMEQLSATFQRVMRMASEGDSATIEIFQEAGRHLGVALANQINANDPGHVIIQTSVQGLAALLEPSFHRALEINAVPVVLERTSFQSEVPPDDWRWKGAAALALEQIYSRE
ncbi:putative NBD/HSP70 family sugar kinase [Sphingobium boeckii]|uniref:Putative NBD/HSP70 family sugar kinase n=1 Tax=Sphingobium boeckii TaxID=1082345 RepID=A0A7W9AHY2_9SPHN|nr:putative NBD/HSP70 family sugar kinase [Sphingobium boeckii]